MIITRKLRAVAGELGDVDPAAMHERLRGLKFDYKIYDDEDCLVETDCEPPHPLNAEALQTVLEIAMLLRCRIPDEVHVMRKTVIDGSNTSGFQRTLIAGLGGEITTDSGPVGITNVCLEEEAAQILERGRDTVVYGLDRLGIPLVEIGTSADIESPEHAREVASRLGMLLRSTGKVKRGIGTIRQDINVSISEGSRVEIKGTQELRLVPKLVENEALRQASLVEVMKELKNRGFIKFRGSLNEVTSFFKKSESRIVQGKSVYAVIVPGFSGFFRRQLTSTRTLGNEIANYARVRTGIPGIIHSDEDLHKYGLESEFSEIRKKMQIKNSDMLIIMAAEKAIAERSAAAIGDRINRLFAGVPPEVRKAMPNGDTEFLRPLPGAARMYPETDVPPIKITRLMLDWTRKNLPETWEKKIIRIGKSYGLPNELAKQIVRSGLDHLFESLAKKNDPKMVSSVLLSTLREIEKEGLDSGNITENHLEELFGFVAGRRIAKEAVPSILREIARDPGKTVQDVIKKSGIEGMETEDLEKIIQKILREKKELLTNPRREKILMGLVMQEVRGRVDGKTVMDTLVRELKKAR
jgi:glutamyl-tRNA(Gln) amidotransferase subunit E